MTDSTSPHSDKASLSYKDAGVDIDAGNALVDRIKGVAKRTLRPEVMGGLGGFGALCQLPSGYREPVLVSGTDGVGTKLRLAMDLGRHDSIGIDLVAMCVNDLVVAGAEPLFFLDYYATGKLDVDIAADVVAGIGEGCERAGCALVGVKRPRCPACTRAATTIWPASVSAWWRNPRSSTAARSAKATCCWASPPAARTPTAIR